MKPSDASTSGHSADFVRLHMLQSLSRTLYWEWDAEAHAFHVHRDENAETTIWTPALSPDGKPDVSLVAPSDRQAVLMKLLQIRNGRTTEDFTFRARANETKPYRTLTVRTSEVSRGGRIVCGIVQDSSDQNALSERTQLAQETLLDAVEFLEDGFVIYDAEDRLVVCNERYRELYPKSAHAMVPGTTFTAVIKAGLDAGEYAGAIGREEEWLQERLAQHNRSNTEIEQQLSDGRWLRIAERMTAGGARIGLRVDITRIKQNAEALAERAESIRAILDTVVDGIVTIDASGNILTFNPASERMFGMRRADVLGKNVGILMTEEYRDRHDSFIAGYLAGNAPGVIGQIREFTAQRADGTEFPVELAIGRMEIAGQPRFVGIIRDISERKQLDRIKREFISTVSHELKTPLTSITGALGLVRGGVAGDLPDQVRDIIDIAYRNSERLGLLVTDILDVEKIDAGRMSYDMRESDISALIGECVETMRTYASEYNVTIAIAETAANPGFTGDPDRITQVISNLLSNAVKFSRPGQQVEIGSSSDATGVSFYVRDQGEGIPEDAQDRIFTRFFRVDSSDQRHSSGTGLGLSICKPIIEAHGGTISVQSTVGKGSTFEVRIPV